VLVERYVSTLINEDYYYYYYVTNVHVHSEDRQCMRYNDKNKR